MHGEQLPKQQLTIYSAMRAESQRVPNKMLAPFVGLSLAEIMCSKLAELQERGWPVVLASRGEAFRVLADKYRIPYVERSYDSVNAEGPVILIHEFVRDFRTPWVMDLNGCMPLLKTETIEQFASVGLSKQKPCFGLLKDQDFFMDQELRPVNWKPGDMISTKLVRPLYRFAHAMYFYNRAFFLDYKIDYWDWNDVEYIKMPDHMELYDIDWPWQFRIAEQLYMTEHNLVHA